MDQSYRLSDIGLINRDRKLSFKFNGKTYYGYEGDTLASALIANGVHLIGRSFKYHRPRGFFGAGVDEPYAIVQLYRNGETEPNIKATEQELFEGLEATSVNCWPSVNFDIGAINNFLKIFLPAGFYYKTFMWPKSFWYKIYEPFIRKAAGLGVASIKHDKERYEHKYEYCDVLVAGSGPSGLASAYAAAKNGARVILAEDKARFGGTLLTSDVNIGNKSGKEWAEGIIAELKEMPNVTVKNRSQVFGYYDHNMLVMSERISDHLPKTKKFHPKQRLWYIRAKEVLISAGSIERPIVFGNNDTPGVMLSSAAKEYLKVYGVLVGRNPLIFTNNDSGYETAIEFKKNGVDPIILDTRKDPQSEVVDEAKNLGINIKFSYVVVAAQGYKKVKSADIAKISDNKEQLGTVENIKCDCICVSGFWTPTIHLASQSGNKTKFNEDIDAFVPGISKQNETTIGAANGSYTLEETLKSSFETGHKLSKKITNNNNEISFPNVVEKKSTTHDKFWCVPLPVGKNYKRFLDFQNDVAVSDVEIALKEGYRSIEHVKRYTTLGMATDQGKTSNLNGLQLVSNIENKVGTKCWSHYF
jgi:sarcosine oxidase subunit alpha